MVGRRRGHAAEPRLGEPIDGIANHLHRLVVRLGLAGLLAALLLVASLERPVAAEVALSLSIMGVVAVASWQFAPLERWVIVLLGAVCWTAAKLELWQMEALETLPWWEGASRLGVLASLAVGVRGFRDATARLCRTEDTLAATLLRERDLARRDRLTRLWNARYFHDALEHEIARCHRYGRPFGLLLIDLDGFKAVNDTAGHLAGDHVLQVVGRALSDGCRGTDIPARLGGDEFAVILPEASVDTVRHSAARLVSVVAGAPFRPGLPPVTASVGGVAFREAPSSGKMAVAAADQAMYAAKREGKNRFVVTVAGRVR